MASAKEDYLFAGVVDSSVQSSVLWSPGLTKRRIDDFFEQFWVG